MMYQKIWVMSLMSGSGDIHFRAGTSDLRSAQLPVPFRARNGLNVMLSNKSLFDAFHIWMTLGSGFMENVAQNVIYQPVSSPIMQKSP